MPENVRLESTIPIEDLANDRYAPPPMEVCAASLGPPTNGEYSIAPRRTWVESGTHCEGLRLKILLSQLAKFELLTEDDRGDSGSRDCELTSDVTTCRRMERNQAYQCGYECHTRSQE